MDPALYILLEPNAFVLPVSPGRTTIYPQFAAPAQMKIITNIFARNKNYYLSYMNINHVCFRMLNKNDSRPIQGLKYPQFDRVECVDVHLGHY